MPGRIGVIWSLDSHAPVLMSSKSLYQRAKTLATQALEIDPEQRADWIATACEGDSQLVAEVGWLVAAAEDDSEDGTPEQFQARTESVIREVSFKVPLPRDYRLVRRLDEGGAGVVYLAERIDGDLRQPVALKLLKLTSEADSHETRRFATERQILSRLSHRNIAHLIDGGLTTEGRPFLATEFVDGKPIDRYCENRGCSVGQVLALFLKVCDAVDYAHRHMVIHRDIKPSNILVTSDGEPKLLDFGIARLVDAERRSDPTVTDSGDHAMTLAYASPEQIEGRGLTAATDVYSLGIVLHQLLTGSRPFDHVGQPHQLPAAVVAGDLQIAGRALNRRLGRSAGRDMQAILEKALRTDPESRYPSVRDLIEDIQRLRKHRPVLARRGHLAYRLHRFVWRHRWAVGVGALLVVLVGVFFIDREAQLNRIAMERDRAEAVTGFMTALFAGADALPTRGNEVTVREILDMGREQLMREAEVSPDFLGAIHLALGRAYNALGLGEQALPLLIQAQESLAPEAGWSEQALIQAEIAAALDSAGRALEAIAADERAIALYESAAGSHHERLLELRIRKLRNHANVLDQPLARTMSELAEIAELLSESGTALDDLRFEALSALVGAQVVAGEADRALANAVTARDLAATLYAEDDPRRLRSRFVHATALMLTDPDAAVADYEQLVADYRRLIGPSQRLANLIGNYGVALSRIGRNDQAMGAFREAADMIAEVLGRDHYLYRLSVSNLAAGHLRRGEPALAEALIGEILNDLARGAGLSGGVEAVYHAQALEILGSAVGMQGRLGEAAAAYRQALSALEQSAAREASAIEATLAARLAEVERRIEQH